MACTKSLFDKVPITSMNNEKWNWQNINVCIEYCLNDSSIRTKAEKLISLKQVKLSKCDSKSIEYRNKGNEFYQKRQLVQCTKLYTSAIRYGVEDSESLALAYGNRSAAYYHLAKWDLCIEDVDLAFDSGFELYRDKQKLLVRKCECLISLKRFQEANNLLKVIQTDDIKENLEDRCLSQRLQYIDMLQDCYDDPIIDETSRIYIELSQKLASKFENSLLSNSVKIDYSKEHGRFIVAKKDINPGDILIVENAFVNVLLPDYELVYCHNCCRRLDDSLGRNSIPCKRCINVLFCSVKCRDEALKYHQLECDFLPLFQNMGIAHLVFRLFLITNIETILYTARKYTDDCRVDISTEPTRGFTSKYDAVYNLAHHLDQISSEDFSSYTFAIHIFFLALERSGWCVDVQTKFALFRILLKHFAQLPINAQSLSDIVVSSDHAESIEDIRNEKIGSALFPTASLLNHSCDPDVVILFEQGTFMVVRSKRQISKGSPIYNCYGPIHCNDELQYRQTYLFEQYHFKCKCHVCIDETSRLELPLDKSEVLILNVLSNSQKSFDFIDSNWQMIYFERINHKLLSRLGNHFDQISRDYANHGNIGKAIFYCEKRSLPICEYLHGSTSLQTFFELCKLLSLYPLLGCDKLPIDLTSRCFLLANTFRSITGDDSSFFDLRYREVESIMAKMRT